MNRRVFSTSAGVVAMTTMSGCLPVEDKTEMYGIIGKMIAVDNGRDELIGILLAGTQDMPGCLSYVISEDLADENALWVTEVWESEDDHKASLSLEPVQQAIARGRPLIAGFGDRFETAPVGGHGLR